MPKFAVIINSIDGYRVPRWAAIEIAEELECLYGNFESGCSVTIVENEADLILSRFKEYPTLEGMKILHKSHGEYSGRIVYYYVLCKA